ncbi:MAG TPA: DeoR/GlpR family DNA-binding transcription regulator [Lacisediminihabitans sp.]|nr:DeoR/GlpR family DNA-binding transcription regulator [Lacisediminihabitans sp.]HXD62885.1 DeoR/GlpR family DNA-binding transcription regulator [Lacisediminihabitans sp.]
METDGQLRPAASNKRSRRMIQILDLLSVHESVSLAEFADALGVSAATVRRDLADLDYQRLLRRTHGGATVMDSRAELPVALRDTQFLEAKRLIGRQMALLIPPERHAVALSGGSTTAQVARALSNHRDLTIITNSLTIAGLVTTYPQLKVIMTGGSLRSQSLELVGILAENTFNAINVGTAILGTDGITASGGVTTHDDTEARTNHAMVTHAQRTVVVADGSKIGRLAMAKVTDIDQVDALVTDDTADPDALAEIEQTGVTVHVVSASARAAATG